MAFDLTVRAMAKGLAQHASTRQGLVTENVANADTIGFRARDVDAFSEIFEQTMTQDVAQRARRTLESSTDFVAVGPDAFRATATRPGHVGYAEAAAAGRAGPLEAREIAREGSESPNGNSVSLEDQMARGAQAALSHNMALSILRKSGELIRMAISSPR